VLVSGSSGVGRRRRGQAHMCVEAHTGWETAARRARRGSLQPAHTAAMWVEGRRAVEQTGLRLFGFGDCFFQAS